MKIQSSEQGVVLVITLIMLSVVTVMAVLFLGVSRRERASVSVTTDHITAKAMTESGFAHAQANIVFANANGQQQVQLRLRSFY